MEAVRLIGKEVGTESVRLPGNEVSLLGIGRSGPTGPMGSAEVWAGRLKVIDRMSEAPGTDSFGETRLTEMSPGESGRHEVETESESVAVLAGGRPPAVDVTGQMVVVTLIIVVDVNSSVALTAGQLVTLAAHLVMVYVDVT